MKRFPPLCLCLFAIACADQISEPQPLDFSLSPTLSLTQSIVCGAPAPGILSWWSGDDNTLDPVGSHDATLEFGATYAPGIAGSAFSFDGVEAMVAIGEHGYPDSEAFTIAAWIWIDGTDPQPRSSAWTIYADDGHGFWLYDDLPRGTGGEGLKLTWWQSGFKFLGATEISVGEWHHIALTNTIEGVISGYVDGDFDGDSFFPYPGALLPGWYRGLGIGRHGGGTPEPFKGLIDEVQVYGRALSEGEIELLACATPMAQVGAIERAIEGLASSGVLEPGNANALLTTLKNVTKSIVKEKPNVSNLLEAFINKVHGFVNGGILTPDEGQALIDAAQSLIDRLVGS